MIAIRSLTNSIIIGPDTGSFLFGTNCVLVGGPPWEEGKDLGENLFHVEGVCSFRVESKHWAAAVADARDEALFFGWPSAFAPVCEIAEVPADEVGVVLVQTLHSIRRRRAHHVRHR